jgi:hypothetical protein
VASAVGCIGRPIILRCLYLVAHHEQRNALDFCTSSFTTQVARCPSEAQRMLCSKHMRNTASQMEMRYYLEKLLSKGNPSGPVNVRLHVSFATIHTTRACSARHFLVLCPTRRFKGKPALDAR